MPDHSIEVVEIARPAPPPERVNLYPTHKEGTTFFRSHRALRAFGHKEFWGPLWQRAPYDELMEAHEGEYILPWRRCQNSEVVHLGGLGYYRVSRVPKTATPTYGPPPPWSAFSELPCGPRAPWAPPAWPRLTFFTEPPAE